MRRCRTSLALLYVLATVVVQGAHLHGAVDEDARSQHEAGCADPRPHIAGHDSPDLSQDRDECQACQFRAVHHACLADSPEILQRDLARPDSSDRSSLTFSTHVRNTCRAPPGLETA